ncbi:MAG: hypothetical protein R3F49_11650 [Planctomycetota bacterium]
MARTPRLAWLVVALALGVRLALLGYLGDATGFHQAERAARGVTWDWGYEQGAIAQALVDGRGFSDPFLRGSGPTGWAAPLYPLLVAALLKLFGGVVYGAAVALAALQAIASAFVSLWLWRLARALAPADPAVEERAAQGAYIASRIRQWVRGGDCAGALAALLWALHPLAAYLPVTLVWDSTFVALGLSWFLARVAEEGPAAPASTVARLGAGFGVLLLVNPAPLALTPALLWYWAGPRGLKPGARNGAAFVAAAALVAGPWALRNLAVLGTPNLRSNLGVELYVGNNDGARGTFNGPLHPAYNDLEYAQYLELGEVPYAAHCQARAVAWAKANPARFARLSLDRAQRFWFGPLPWQPIVLGSGAERRRDWQGWIEWLTHAGVGLLGLAGACWARLRPGGATLIRGALVLYPLVYYVTHVFERYRFPLEPVVVASAALLLARLARRFVAR